MTRFDVDPRTGEATYPGPVARPFPPLDAWRKVQQEFRVIGFTPRLGASANAQPHGAAQKTLNRVVLALDEGASGPPQGGNTFTQSS
jgi:hypothetical protein